MAQRHTSPSASSVAASFSPTKTARRALILSGGIRSRRCLSRAGRHSGLRACALALCASAVRTGACLAKSKAKCSASGADALPRSQFGRCP
eukprot:4560040-Alexandrium_andersonii.AAC.1